MIKANSKIRPRPIGAGQRTGAKHFSFTAQETLSSFGIFLLIALNTAHKSYMLPKINPGLPNIVFSLELLILGAFSLFTLRNGRFRVFALQIALYGYFIAQTVLFSTITKSPVNLNAAFPMLMLGAFVVFIDAKNREPYLRSMYIASLVYAVCYMIVVFFFPTLFMDEYFTNEFIKNGTQAKFIGKDHSSDFRIPMAQAFMLYGLCYAVFEILNKRKFLNILPILLFIACILFADYRFFTASIFLIGILYIINFRLPIFRYVVGAAFIVVNIYSIWGLLDPDFNMFAAVADDFSGYARFHEYEAAKTMVQDHPFFGVGIATSQTEIDLLARTPVHYYFTDIGAMGVLSAFGFIGLSIYLIIGLLCVTYDFRKSAYQNPGDFALLGTGYYIAINSAISPDYWGGTSAIFAAIILSMYLSKLTSSTNHTAIHRRVRKRRLARLF